MSPDFKNNNIGKETSSIGEEQIFEELNGLENNNLQECSPEQSQKSYHLMDQLKEQWERCKEVNISDKKEEILAQEDLQ